MGEYPLRFPEKTIELRGKFIEKREKKKDSDQVEEGMEESNAKDRIILPTQHGLNNPYQHRQQ
jgi:hypothetical protein